MAQVTTIELTMMINHLKGKNTEPVIKEALNIFLKLVQNILNSPTDERFKVIKRNNKTIQDKWLKCQGIIDIALAVGYEEVDEIVMNFSGEIENLSNLKQSIISYLNDSAPSQAANPETKSGVSSQAYLHSQPSQPSLPITPEVPETKHTAKAEDHKIPTSQPTHGASTSQPTDHGPKVTPKETHTATEQPGNVNTDPKHTPNPNTTQKTAPGKAEPPKDKAKPVEINQVHSAEPDYQLEWSGSSYVGPIKDGWFEGKGRFKFPSGVVYEGEFYKGEFHGKGTLIFTNGGKYKATWNRGKAVDGEYEYYDGLIYDSQNWNYCQIPDRRFYTEIKEGLRPAGATLMVNDAKGPKNMAHGTYDVGEGYYDRNKNMVYSYEGEEKYVPEDTDISDIIEKYRYNPSNL